MTESDPRRDYIRNAIVDALGAPSERVCVGAVITDRKRRKTVALRLISRFLCRSGSCRRHLLLSMQ